MCLRRRIQGGERRLVDKEKNSVRGASACLLDDSMGFGKPGLCREQRYSDSTSIITGLRFCSMAILCFDCWVEVAGSTTIYQARRNTCAFAR